MHFSRMRTGRSLTVCWSLLPGEGVCLLGRVSGPGGVCLQGGVSGSGGSGPRGECLVLGGLPTGGVYLRGGLPPGGSACHRHPPVDRITDACKNITLAQLRCGR